MGFAEGSDQIREATAAVMEWIKEKHGEEVAEWWFWEATPMPCWLPSQQQLLDGLDFALGRWSVAQFRERNRGQYEYEMRQVTKAIREERAVGNQSGRPAL